MKKNRYHFGFILAFTLTLSGIFADKPYAFDQEEILYYRDLIKSRHAQTENLMHELIDKILENPDEHTFHLTFSDTFLFNVPHIDPFSNRFEVNAQEREKTIHISPYYILSPDEYPERFQLEKPYELESYTEEYLEEHIAWLNEVLEIKNPYRFEQFSDASLTDFLKRHYLSIAYLWENPELHQKSFEFILGHEISHTIHDYPFYFKWRSYDLMELITISSITKLFLEMSTESQLCYIAFIMACREFQYMLMFSEQREVEALCDESAVNAIGDAEGGIYYFEQMRKAREDCEKKGWFSEWMEWLKSFYTTHPDFKERIERLKSLAS